MRLNFKHIPNAISILRIILSLCLLGAMLNKTAFLILFVTAGVTDVLDGFLARRLKSQSEFGARLDSIGDFVFFVCATIGVLYISHFNLILIIGVAAIAFVRFVNMLLFKIRFKKFGGIHTVGNKVSGLIIFALMLYAIIARNLSPYVTIPLFSINILFAIEETLIICTIKDNNFDKKSIFV